MILLFVNLEPSACNEHIEEPNKYMEVNSATKELLNDYSKGILPAKSAVSLSGDTCVYEYRYNCSILGEPSCLVYLNNSFVDEIGFNSELQRIRGISCQNYSMDNGQELYSVRADLKEFYDLYTDDLTEDGRKYIFEFATVNYEEQSIEYLFAVQQDSQAHSNIILDIIGKIAFD